MSFCVAGACPRRSTCWRVFCESHCQRCAKWWQGEIAWQAWHFVTCHENRRKPRTKRRFWGRFVRKLVGKRRFWSCKVVKFEEVSHEMLVLMLQHVSSRVAGFFGAVAVSMGEAAKPIFVECFKTDCHVVLRGRRGTSWHSNMFQDVSKVVLCGRRNTFATFSEDVVAFFVAGAALWTPPMSFCVAGACRRSTLDVSCCVCFVNRIVSAARSGDKVAIAWQAWHFVTCHEKSTEATLYTLHSHFLHSALHTSHFTLYTPHFTLHTLHPTNYSVHFPLHTLHFTLYTLHSTLHTLHSRLYTLHLTPYTVYFTLYTSHFTLHTLHFTLHTLHLTLYTPRSTLYTPHFTLDSLHSTLSTPHFTLHTCTLHSTLYTLHCSLYTLHCALHTPHTLHSTLYTPHFTRFTPHCTLRTLHFTLHTLHFTLHTLYSTLYTPYSTLYTPHFTLYTPHFTLHTLHFTLHTLHFTLQTSHSTL